jgi:uncharacterized protein YyaL (SSP411 family)
LWVKGRKKIMGRRKGIAAAAVWCFLAMIALSACSDTAPSDKASKDTAAYTNTAVNENNSEVLQQGKSETAEEEKNLKTTDGKKNSETIDREKKSETVNGEKKMDEIQTGNLQDHSKLAQTFTNSMEIKELAERDKKRASEMAEQFYKDFYMMEKGFLRLYYPPEVLTKTQVKNEPATCWEYGALMSMQSQLAIMDPEQIPMLHHVNENLDYYGYQKDGELWGYVVRRGSRKLGATDPGLAYDDNEWLVINFLRSYEVTGKTEYLEKAEYLMNFVLEEAWFEPLGGIFWDTRKEARHSCSNQPVIKPLVDLYQHTGKEEYLEWAKKVYDFSITLKNPELNIYEDLVRAHPDEDGNWIEGVPGGGYYTYNTGTMISGAAALYGATGEEKYLKEALSAAKGAYDYFSRTVSDTVTYWPCTSNIWFNCILLRGYIDLYEYAPEQAEEYIMTFQNTMDFAYENYLYEGYLPINWIRGWGTQERDKDLRRNALDHAANIEMYAMLANWQAARSEK